jgi:hypothetical protein
MYSKFYIWVVSPSLAYTKHTELDLTKYIVYAAFGSHDKTLHRWEWIWRNTMTPDKQPADVMFRMRKVQHIKIWRARIYSVHKFRDNALLELETLRLAHKGLICEVLR